MGKIVVPADVLAKVKHFADGGDPMAMVIQAVCDGMRVLTLTVGAEATNTITITGQLSDLDGTPIKVVTDIFITSTPIAGAGTITIGASGTLVKGSGTTSVWLQTNSSGAFAIVVTNASAETNLVRFETDNGQVEAVKLTFA